MLIWANVLPTRGSQPVVKEGLVIQRWRLQLFFSLSPHGHAALSFISFASCSHTSSV